MKSQNYKVGPYTALARKMKENKKAGNIMKYTSAQANKLLKKLNDDYTAILKKEELSKEFLVSLGENAENIRPDYDFLTVYKELCDIESKIRRVKHALNVFNTKTVIPDFNITIDEMLILIPQLTRQKQKLALMKDKLPKMREQNSYSRSSSLVEYRYLNYDTKQVESEYEKVAAKLSKAQIALDLVNNSCKIDIDI